MDARLVKAEMIFCCEGFVALEALDGGFDAVIAVFHPRFIGVVTLHFLVVEDFAMSGVVFVISEIAFANFAFESSFVDVFFHVQLQVHGALVSETAFKAFVRSVFGRDCHGSVGFTIIRR